MPPLLTEDLEHVWLHTQKLWQTAKGQTIFITGGTGFFGVWLLETLAFANRRGALGIQATVLSRDPELFLSKNPQIASCEMFHWIQGDVQSFNFPDQTFDLLVHAATETKSRTENDDPENEFQAIINGTKRVLEFANHAKVKKILVTSSGAVYGLCPSSDVGVSEECQNAPDPLLNTSTYGLAKKISEHLCFLYSSICRYHLSIARCFTFIGPHLPLDQNYAAGNFIRDGLAGKPIHISGDGKSIRSYLYTADLAIWLWTLLLNAKGCGAFNVGSPNAVSIKELGDTIAKVLELPYPIPASPSEKTKPSFYLPDVSKAKFEHGLEQRISLEVGIQRMTMWLNHKRK